MSLGAFSMLFRRRPRVSSAIDYPNFELLPIAKKKGFFLYDFSWPTIAVCGVLLGLVIAIKSSGEPFIIGNITDQVQRLYAWYGSPRPESKVLVITANRRFQVAVIATLSPRGYQPILAHSGHEALALIRANPRGLMLAVVDDTLPDYRSITRTVRGYVPAGGLIVLKGSARPQDIAPSLLERIPATAHAAQPAGLPLQAARPEKSNSGS
jgi:hypothetical protein